MPRYTIAGSTAKFSERPGALEYVTTHHKTKSIADLSRETGVAYASVAQALFSRGLMADRYTVKRRTIELSQRMTPLELAYLAGIVDGEGTITIAARKAASGRIYFRPSVTISNTSERLADWLRAWGYSINTATNSSGRPYWRINWSGFSVDSLLTRLLPFLVIKRPHADLLLEFISLRRALPRLAPPSERMLEIVSTFGWLNERMLALGEREARIRSMISSQNTTSSRPAA
jgi:hypothetical protein